VLSLIQVKDHTHLCECVCMTCFPLYLTTWVILSNRTSFHRVFCQNCLRRWW
jgi:hypothetical protein